MRRKYATGTNVRMKSTKRIGASRALLCLISLVAAPCVADDKSCDALMDSAPECKTFATHAECESILRRSTECKDVPNIGQLVCMLKIGHLMEQYFACQENAGVAPDCATIFKKVDNSAKKLDEAVGCKLQSSNSTH